MQTRRSGSPATKVLTTLGLISGQRQLESCLARLGRVSADQLAELSTCEPAAANSQDLPWLCKRIVSQFSELAKRLLLIAVKERNAQLVYGLLDSGQSAAVADQYAGGNLIMELLSTHHPVIFMPSRHPTLQEDVKLARRLVAAGCHPLLCPHHQHTVLSAALSKGHLPLVKLLLLELKVQLPGAHTPPNSASYYHLLLRLAITRPYSGDYTELAHALHAAGAPHPNPEAETSLLGDLVRRASIEDGLESEAPLDLLDCYLDLGLPVYAEHALPAHHLLCISIEHQNVDKDNFRRLLRSMARAGANINTLYGEVPPEYCHCLHVFIQTAMSGNLPHAPALLRIMLEEGADVAASAARYPSPLDVLVSRGGLLLEDHHQTEAPSCTPDLARMLIEEGCKVEAPLLTPSGELAAPATLHYFAFLLQRHLFCPDGLPRPSPLSNTEMELCRVLMEAAASERRAMAVQGSLPAPEDDTAGSLLDASILLGNLDLVRLLLRTLPEAVEGSEAKLRAVRRQRNDARWWVMTGNDQRSTDSVLSIAADWLRRRLNTMHPPPPSMLHISGVGQAVIQAYHMIEALLEAGATPLHEEVAGREQGAKGGRGRQGRKRPRRQCVAARLPPPPVPPCLRMMPGWAMEMLSFLPAQLSTASWSPATAAAYPPALRAAARTMLLINCCRGFGSNSFSGTGSCSCQRGPEGQQQEQLPQRSTRSMRSTRSRAVKTSAKRTSAGGQRAEMGKALAAGAAHRNVAAGTKRKGGISQGGSAQSTAEEGGTEAGGQVGVELPLDVLCKIINMASRPLVDWVPQLAKCREREEEKGGKRKGERGKGSAACRREGSL